MKKTLIGAALFLLGITANSQTEEIKIDLSGHGAGAQNFIIEVITPSEAAYNSTTTPVPAGALTYRFFIDMEDGDEYGLLGFGANANPQVDFYLSSTDILHNPDGSGQTGDLANPTFWGLPGMEGLEYDSYASDGYIGSAWVGILQSMDAEDDEAPLGYMLANERTVPVIPLQVPIPIEVLTSTTETLSTDPNGGWFPGLVKGPTTDNIVFTGQVTTAGGLTLGIMLDIVHLDTRESTLIPIHWRSNNEAPAITWETPEADSVLYTDSTIVFTVNATDDYAMSHVEFFVNGESIGIDDNTEDEVYSVSWTTTGESAEVYAMAIEEGVQALSTSSDPITFTVEDAPSTSNNEITADLRSEVSIYPNPANSIIYITFEGKADVALITVTGEILDINKNASNSASFDVQDLPAGIYAIMVDNTPHLISITE
jgi:hypothetical protein